MTEFVVPNDGRLRVMSIEAPHGQVRLALARADGKVVPVDSAAKALGISLRFDAASTVSLIESGPEGRANLRQIEAQLARLEALPQGQIKVLPPLPKLNGNITCVGWNYVEHFDEGKVLRDPNQKLPEHPVLFSKGVNALNGAFDPIPYDPAVSAQIDWEVELAVVIGKKGRNIKEADAMNHVFGYTVLNDVSARDLQRAKHGGQWFKGKSLDGHAPMGPWIVLASDLDPANLHLRLRVNGVTKQDGYTAQMYFKIPRILAELSAGLTLNPGDVIATGTPSGVGVARTPPEFLRPGDVMESEIVEIGVMRNTIAAA